jgi:hypothetical protein
LGIYISKDTATVVCLDSQGKDANVLDCFSVSVEEQEQANMQLLASLIAQGCTERELKFSEVEVALDCAMFLQHSVHSEFSDPKRIAATVKFDTEETLATDIADVALAFEIASSDQSGSDLIVFTAERRILSDVLAALQQYDLDPVTMQPDINCLSRFICQKITSAEPRQAETSFGILSQRSGYLVVPPMAEDEGSRAASAVRTFLVGPAQDRAELLTREVLVTTALAEGAEPIDRLKVFDAAGAVDCRRLGEKLSVEAGAIDLCDAAGTEPQTLADCANPVDFAIAYGAALTRSEKKHSANFRDDFSPFQGKKLRLQKTLKFAAISVAVLLAAVGLYFQTQLFTMNKYWSTLNNKFAKDYSAVMLGQKLPVKTSAVSKLGNELRRVRDAKRGLTTIGGQESISSKLTMVLAAFNRCAAQTNLNIKSVSITTRNMSITGDTSSRQNTLKFFKAIRGNGLEISQENYDSKGGRDSFSISVAPKK